MGCRRGHVAARNVHVAFADARAFPEQPQKYGVNVLQGAFTIYNQNGDAGSRVTATLEGISVGTATAPVFGSGIFVSGFGDEGGRLEIDRLTIGEVHSTGLLPRHRQLHHRRGIRLLWMLGDRTGQQLTLSVVAYDMVLDDWGKVDRWHRHDVIESYGPSASDSSISGWSGVSS